jgi:metallo-beta-lactamase class B
MITALRVLACLCAISAMAQAPAPARPTATEPVGAPIRVLQPDPPMTCASCAEWNGPREPFKLFGNTYFVGTSGLSALLIVTDQGLILVDGALTQSTPIIDANIRALGFRPSDIKYILTSHAHYDHAGGLHALQRYTRATVLASASSARAFALGYPVPDDPQYEGPNKDGFPKVENVKVVKHNEATRLGGTTVTPHYMPGHTPGATSWTWQACEGTRCLDIVYGDSLTPIANDTYRFTGSATQPSIVESFRTSINRVAALPCDILVTTHPQSSNLDAKLKGRADKKLAPGAPGDPFVAPGECRALAERSMKQLDERVAAEGKK